MKNEVIAQNLRYYRQRLGLSAGDCAKLLKIQEKDYVSWELGMTQPDVDQIMKISDIFGIEYTALLDEPKKGRKVAPKQEVKISKKTLGMRIAALVLWLAMYGIIAIPLISLSYENISLGTIGIYDFFSASSAYKAIAALIVIVLFFLSLEYFMKVALPKACANETFKRCLNILSLILCVGVVALIIASLALANSESLSGLDVGTFLVPIAIGAVVILTVIDNIKELQGKKDNEKSKKSQ